MEKVSIILPVYNVQDYIKECLDSILKQTYQNLEIILIDDGSKDSSGEICDEYQKRDNRIIVLHKENNGVSAARNSGLELATGTYITFVDPDDWIEVDMIEKMLNTLKSRHAEISFCRFHTEIISPEKKYLYRPIEKEYGDGSDAINQMFQSIAYGTMVWNKLFHRKLIFQQDNSFVKFDENLKCGEDEVWLIEVIQNAERIAYLQDELYYWRVRENSAYRDNAITDTKIMDIIAQEMALGLIKDKKSEAYIRVMERLNEKVYQYRVSAYINKQKDYVNKLDVFYKKYSHFWYQSDRVLWKTKCKRRVVNACISLKLCRGIVTKLVAM